MTRLLERMQADELKYHGGGIGSVYDGRGKLGEVDFFAEAPAAGGACEASDLDGYVCVVEPLSGVRVHHTLASGAPSVVQVTLVVTAAGMTNVGSDPTIRISLFKISTT